MQEKLGQSRIGRKLSRNYRSKSRSRQQQGPVAQKEEASSKENGKSIQVIPSSQRNPKPAWIHRTMSCRGPITIQQQKTVSIVAVRCGP